MAVHPLNPNWNFWGGENTREAGEKPWKHKIAERTDK